LSDAAAVWKKQKQNASFVFGLPAVR